MPHAQVNGINLYYEVHGFGPPLVLLHGYAGTAYSWSPQVSSLGRHHRLILCDLRGHGRSEAPADSETYSVAAVTEDLRQLLAHLGVKQAVIGGLSVGGILAMRFYEAHPDMTRALILCDTGPGYRNPEAMAEWDRRCSERAKLLEERGIEAFMESAFATDDYYTPRDLMRQHNALGLANFSKRVMASPRMVALEEIKVPTLVLCGSRDKPFVRASYYMAQHIPAATLAIIPKAGHASNIDQPDLFNGLVGAWLEDIGA
ncbi:MAG: alpha/beta fold hydrolase [Chloroflexi bacterium]|nr:alpha/beta fold hydrolase [Chloroflexota bacterium]